MTRDCPIYYRIFQTLPTATYHFQESFTRLAFSVATRAEADILLVDEVLAVGDADFQRKCYDYFKALKKNGKTVVFVTHNMSAVKEYCDRAMLIKEGNVAFIGDAAMVSDEYLKMFNRNDGSTETAFNDRWGNFDVKFLSVKAAEKQKSIELHLKVKSSKVVDDLAIEVRINGADGKLVAGFNTKHMKELASLSLNQDETRSLVFGFPNVLGNGKHTIDVGIFSSDGVNIYDNWLGAASIVNTYGDDQANFPVILDARLS